MGIYGSGGNSAEELRKEQQQREIKILSAQQEVGQAFQGFNPAFFEQRRKAFLGQALPQLGEEFNQAQRGLATMLANRGLLKSGAAGQLQGSLEAERGKQKMGLVGRATDESNRLRAAVSDQQSQLMSQAIAGLDPSLARSSALQSASNVMATSPVSQVSNMFGDWANVYLANQQLQGQRQANNMTRQLVSNSKRNVVNTQR